MFFFSIYVLPHLLPFGFLFVHGWLAPFCMALLQENCKASLQRKSSFEKMDQERLKVLSLQVLLQILQQVVLEISNRIVEPEGGNGGGYGSNGSSGSGGGGGGGGSGLTAGFGEYTGGAVGPVGGFCVGGGVGPVGGCSVGHVGHHAASSFEATDELLVPNECRFRCRFCNLRCNRGYKDGHKHHSCWKHRHCRDRWNMKGEKGVENGLIVVLGVGFGGKTKHFTACYCIWKFAGWIDGMMHAMSNIRIFMIAHEVSRYSVFCVQDNRIYTAQKKVVYYYHPRFKKDAFRFKYNSQLQKQKGSPSVFTKKRTGWP